MSLRTFAENVINLAVEGCLVQDLPKILNSSTILDMSENELRNLAQESQDISSTRKSLDEQIKNLSVAVDKCRKQRIPVRTGTAPVQLRKFSNHLGLHADSFDNLQNSPPGASMSQLQILALLVSRCNRQDHHRDFAANCDRRIGLGDQHTSQ